MAEKEPGYVYILTNPSFREDWVKIGMTSNMEDRLKTLDNTSVPLPFEKYATLKTVKYQKAEKLVHHYIERFTNLRIRDNREFFNVRPEVALSIFREVAELLDDAEIEEFVARSKKVSSKTQNKKNKTEELPTKEEWGESSYDGRTPRFSCQAILPRYLNHLNSKLTKETIMELGMGDSIDQLVDISQLKELRRKIVEKEKVLKYHHTHSCAISKYINYLENGFTYLDFKYDASLKNGKTEIPVSREMSKPRESAIKFSQFIKEINGTCYLEFFPKSKRYILKAGTIIKEETTHTCSKEIALLRETVKNDNTLSRKENGNYFTLLKDLELPTASSSPSGASKFCWGTSRPGPTDWKDEEGKSYPTEWWKKD